MEYDVVIVGAGPAGLTAAIRLKQLAEQNNTNLTVCIVEKGAEVGAHILSGAVIETRALDELLPQWQSLQSPLSTQAIDDQFFYLTKNKSIRLPTPPQMKNQGNYIVSLGQFCKWLATIAEQMGVEIYPGFPAREIVIDENDHVQGIITGSVGIDKQHNKTDQFQAGMFLKAKQTLLAEGCRGSLTKIVLEKFSLQKNCQPQTYGLGVKELWEVDKHVHHRGQVIHTVGWPLDNHTYGGSFIYHFDENKVAIGFVVGLDYKNPTLNPFEELQQFKHHPFIKPLFENGQRICYGARALNEGGLQSIPELAFKGGMLIGDSAGFLNVPKIKGTHTAMKSAILAAENVFQAISNNKTHEPINYYASFQQSWAYEELYRARNIRPAFRKGLWTGLAYAALDTYLLRGKAPWTFKQHQDYAQLSPLKDIKPLHYPKPDGKISFDKLSSVYLSNTHHEENQPCHLELKDKSLAIEVNYKIYGSPEQYYCPANVYEIIMTDRQQPILQINAQNCIHCKTCDIKDPRQNINWIPPEGGGGPHYSEM